MSLNLSNNNTSNFSQIPAGTYVARCIQVIDLGTQSIQYMGENKRLSKVRITWETPFETKVFSPEKGEQPYYISQEYTASLNEKAVLRKMLESWRGRGFTEEELKSFDLSKLLNLPCQINVIHKEGKNGKTYIEVAAVMQLTKGMTCPESESSIFFFDLDNPDWGVFDKLPTYIQEKIKLTPEYESLRNAEMEIEVEETIHTDGLPDPEQLVNDEFGSSAKMPF